MATASLTASPQTLNQLVQVLKNEIAAGRKIIQQTQINMYRNMGRHIHNYGLHGADRAKYGAKIYEHLSRAIGLSVDVLQRSVRVYLEFPISAPARKLTWSHYVNLLALPDPSTRRRFIQKALRENLTSKQLRKEIVQVRRTINIDPNAPIPQLKAVKGRLHTYTVIEAPDGQKYLDCGFDVWHYQPSAKPAAKNDYTYKAKVQNVIDGDTLWVVVDLGFKNFTRQKLRLRGIDCAEIATPEGRRAKRFVQSLIKPEDIVLIRTQKTDDKYGRYLCDIWCGEGEKEIYLNQELLNQRLAVGMRE